MKASQLQRAAQVSGTLAELLSVLARIKDPPKGGGPSVFIDGPERTRLGLSAKFQAELRDRLINDLSLQADACRAELAELGVEP